MDDFTRYILFNQFRFGLMNDFTWINRTKQLEWIDKWLHINLTCKNKRIIMFIQLKIRFPKVFFFIMGNVNKRLMPFTFVMKMFIHIDNLIAQWFKSISIELRSEQTTWKVEILEIWSDISLNRRKKEAELHIFQFILWHWRNLYIHHVFGPPFNP
jgi:hypothetical protein